MRTLIVIANPSLKSFSFEILQTVKIYLENLNHNVTVLDLYREKPQQQFYTHDNLDLVTYYQNLIYKADELIFIHPIYWCAPPAILKNFLEQNFREGFAYKYDSDNSYKPLLLGKNIRLIITSNESEKVYEGIGLPFKVVWDEFSIGTGMEIKDLIHIGDMKTNHNKRNKILKDITKRLEKWEL